MIEISFNRFRTETRHKPMRYKFIKKDGTIKEFETNKFYANKDTRLKIIRMPKFILSQEGKFFKDGNKWIAISEYGNTEFEEVV